MRPSTLRLVRRRYGRHGLFKPANAEPWLDGNSRAKAAPEIFPALSFAYAACKFRRT
jgi:hypothetical protein